MIFPDMSPAQNVYKRKPRYVAIEAHNEIIIHDEKKTSLFQFQVGYTTHPMLKNIRHKEDSFIKMLNPNFKTKQWKLSEIYCKKYVLFISLIILYHSNKSVVFKVMGYVIYSFVNNFICLDYLGILQQKLSAYNNKFEKN